MIRIGGDDDGGGVSVDALRCVVGERRNTMEAGYAHLGRTVPFSSDHSIGQTASSPIRD
ncbi:MAG: hypothetical protein METHAR1v1_1360006 [Methanothrix sp.]|nr:MAG: hypothetical protein METHAR1v1_1360006 [Methanothrix sp.]